MAIVPVSGVSHAKLLAASVYVLFVAGFRVYHLHQSYIRQLLCPSVVYLNSHYVVLAVADDESLLKVLSHVEVAKYESCATSLAYASEKLQCLLYVSLTAFGLEVEHFPDDIKDMFSTLFRWYVFLYFVGEEYHPDLVVVLNGTEGECCRYLSHHVALGLHFGTEVERAADIDEQHHR